MRVMLVGHRYPPDDVGGVERVLELLATHLPRQGDDVSVVVRRWNWGEPGEPQASAETLPSGARLLRFTGGDYRHERFLLHHERIERLFVEELLAFRPDVVHVCHVMALSPRCIELAQRHGAAVVLSLFDYYFACQKFSLSQPSGALCGGPDGGRECARVCFASEGAAASVRWGLRTAYFRRLLRMAERVVCPMPYVADFFREHGADPARMRIVPVGTPAEGPPRAPIYGDPQARGHLNLAFVGSVVPHKGPHLILEALAQAALGAVRLDLYGQCPDPDYLCRLRQRAAEIPGLRFQVHGAYTPEQLPDLLREADCTLAPSQIPETFGIVVREAHMLGIPVLVSRIGALPAAVEEGRNGFTFDNQNPAELAGLLRRLATEDGLLDRLRAGARATPVMYARQFAWAMRTIYQEALDDFALGGATRWGDLDELDFLHNELVRVGFASLPPRRGRPQGAAASARETSPPTPLPRGEGNLG